MIVGLEADAAMRGSSEVRISNSVYAHVARITRQVKSGEEGRYTRENGPVRNIGMDGLGMRRNTNERRCIVQFARPGFRRGHKFLRKRITHENGAMAYVDRERNLVISGNWACDANRAGREVDRGGGDEGAARRAPECKLAGVCW